ncbi:alpha/beta hydrolase family protein [Ceratobasidium sp. AG-Ba]|nr:alpha/beta hydrolase family protein [Ceratobasidium sp. AG-Ba]QRW07538.1 alpha/beta hydrolase family protein [Ceratobasidium sp. AG-Ba]
MFESVQWFAKTSASVVVGATTLGAGLLYYGQNSLIYPANVPEGSRTNVATPAEYGIPYTDLTFTTPDKVKIRAYLLIQRRTLLSADGSVGSGEIDAQGDDAEFARSRPTVLFLHANAGNVGHRIPLAKVFYNKFRCNVLMLSYRGYGLSEGQPSEKGLKIDAQKAFDYILEHPILQNTRIVLYGQSIGGAVAFYLASQNSASISALIVENTFMTLPSLIPTVLPVAAPLAFLCHQIWDSASAARSLPTSVPVLLLSGSADELVPPTQMQGLHDILSGAEGSEGQDKGTHDDKATLDAPKSFNKRHLVFKKLPNGHHSDRATVSCRYYQSGIQGRRATEPSLPPGHETPPHAFSTSTPGGDYQTTGYNLYILRLRWQPIEPSVHDPSHAAFQLLECWSSLVTPFLLTTAKLGLQSTPVSRSWRWERKRHSRAMLATPSPVTCESLPSSYLQTIPGEIKLYRRQYEQGRISIVCILFIAVRYISIVSLVLNGIGFYSTSFDLDSCRKFRLAPPVTKMLAGLASQGLIFMRTWAISRKSRFVLVVLSALCVISLPLLIIGNVYKRSPFVKNGSCIAKQPVGVEFNSAPLYYGAMAGFDLIACGIATYYLIDRSAGAVMSKFTKKVLQHGMMYALGTTLVNVIVLLGVSHVKYVEKLGAFLSVAVTMIMAQHLVLATQSIRVPPPALEHIVITDHLPTLSSSETTNYSPHTAKTGFAGKLAVVPERDELSTTRSPLARVVFDIEQHPAPYARSHSPPVGFAL